MDQFVDDLSGIKILLVKYTATSFDISNRPGRPVGYDDIFSHLPGITFGRCVLFCPQQKVYDTGTSHKAYNMYFIIYLVSSRLGEGHV